MSRVRLFVAAVFAMLLLAPAGASAADKVANPGQFTAEVTGGDLQLKDFIIAIDELEGVPTITGNVDALGNITVPSNGVNFPPLALELEGAEINVFVMATGTDWTGSIDPDTGEFVLNARLRVKAEGSPLGIGLGSSCYVGASGTGNNLWLNPATTGSIPANGAMVPMTGTPYDSETGDTTVVNNTVSVPGADGCGPLGLANGPVNDALGLPSASGNNSMALELRFTQNAPQPPVVSRFSADPEQGRVPFTVDFDSSASTSTLGDIEYRWDFDGDGT
ncbi:MAG: hypothetical protein M3Y23_07170, partial [Actinomycetota bacterium]|nr:hypothetical protein [Actinomycetota bacterium]